MQTFRGRRWAVPAVAAGFLVVLFSSAALAHEEREINGYAFEVGFISEPVFVGERSGLEFIVNQNDTPVEGLEKTLTAQVTYGSSTRDLPISARDGVPGTYESVFIPTAAGPYTFKLKGTLPDGSTMDQSFTSSPTGFDEVQESTAGQFPVQFPSQAELVSNAQQGADAAGKVTIAIGLGVAGLIVGLAALGVAIAGRSRSK